MEHTKVSKTDGKLTVRPRPVLEHQAVTRAVHGLHGELAAFALESEHVVLVVLPVAGCSPQVSVVDVRRDDFLKATLAVLASDEFDELVVDASAMRQPEAGTRGERVEEEKLLRLAQVLVIALLGFGEIVLVLGELFL